MLFVVDFSHFVCSFIQYVERPFWLFCFCSSCWLDSTLISVSVARSVHAHSYACVSVYVPDWLMIVCGSRTTQILFATRLFMPVNFDILHVIKTPIGSCGLHHLHTYYVISTQSDTQTYQRSSKSF